LKVLFKLGYDSFKNSAKTLPEFFTLLWRQLKCLQFLVENGYRCDDMTYRLSFETENQEIIEYVRDHMICRWDN
jgi:uncharacterized Fe-S cluster-containing radical SAM superfamily protein